MTRANPLLDDQLRMLTHLAEAGLSIATAIEREATAPSSPRSAGDLALPYSRVARAVRQTILLQAKLCDDREASGDSAPEAAPLSEAELAVEHHKARVERIVERVAKAETYNEDELDRLVIEAGERLDDEDLYGDVLSRPVSELVALICRDLGLHPDWARLAEEAWAVEEAAAGVADWPPTRPPPLAGEMVRRTGGGMPPPLRPDPAFLRDTA